MLTMYDMLKQYSTNFHSDFRAMIDANGDELRTKQYRSDTILLRTIRPSRLNVSPSETKIEPDRRLIRPLLPLVLRAHVSRFVLGTNCPLPFPFGTYHEGCTFIFNEPCHSLLRSRS